jgi:hypothetical protein
MQQQTRDLMRAFNQVAQHPVGVWDPGQTAQIGTPSMWSWDTRVRAHRAFIRRLPGAQNEYWVHVDYDDYREKFLSFLDSEFGLPRSAIHGTWHADHTLNRAFARKHGISFVRMALLQAPANIDYGRLMEKSFTNTQANSKSMYLLDYAVMMKLLNVPPPLDQEDYTARREQIADTFLAAGFDGSRELVLQGMDGMFTLWDVIRPSRSARR